MATVSQSSSSNKPYKVLNASGPEGGWFVMEQPTGLLMNVYDDSRDAKLFANQLNGGNGFRGWTPAYLLERFIVV